MFYEIYKNWVTGKIQEKLKTGKKHISHNYNFPLKMEYSMKKLDIPNRQLNYLEWIFKTKNLEVSLYLWLPYFNRYQIVPVNPESIWETNKEIVDTAYDWLRST